MTLFLRVRTSVVEISCADMERATNTLCGSQTHNIRIPPLKSVMMDSGWNWTAACIGTTQQLQCGLMR